MSTNNFAFENILVALDDEQAEDFDFFIKENIQVDLEEKFPEGYRSDNYLHDGLSQSYGGKEMFVIEFRDRTGELYKTLQVIYRGGYYGGMNLDYLITDEGNECVGTKGLDNKIESATKKIEKILRSHGQELIKVAQFSNGEAMYQKINRK